MLMHEHLPPHDLEFERSVLGACLIPGGMAVDRLVGRVKVEHFYRHAHALVWEAIETLYRGQNPVDFQTVRAALECAGLLADAGGPEYLMELLEVVPTAANCEFYADQVLDRWMRRELIRAGTALYQAAYEMEESPVEIAQRTAASILDLGCNSSKSAVRKLSAVLDDVFSELERWEDERPGACSTGLRDLDEVLGPIPSDSLIIIAARPSMGKTGLAGGMAEHIARHHGPVLFATMEMSDTDIGQRILSPVAGMPASLFRKGPKAAFDPYWDSLAEGLNRLRGLPLYFFSGKASVMELRSMAQRIAIREGRPLAAVFADRLEYLRGIRSEQGSFYASKTQAWGELHDSAILLHTPHFVLSQLSREVEKRENKRPVMSDLRDTGAAEENAQVILFIYREHYYTKDPAAEGLAELIVAKNQRGITKTVPAAFVEKFVQFRDLAKAQHHAPHWTDGSAS